MRVPGQKFFVPANIMDIAGRFDRLRTGTPRSYKTYATFRGLHFFWYADLHVSYPLASR
jgi:hypothetical protein